MAVDPTMVQPRVVVSREGSGVIGSPQRHGLAKEWGEVSAYPCHFIEEKVSVFRFMFFCSPCPYYGFSVYTYRFIDSDIA